MTSRPILQSSDSSFDDQNTVPPWRALIDHICQDLEDPVFRKLLFLSKDILGQNVYQKLSDTDASEVCYHQYFSALEDNLGENGTVDHLEHLMNHINLHSDTGENYGDEIRKYIEAKKLYLQRCSDKGISLDPNFVGRELMLEDVLKYLRKDYKGVVLCGISGIGKTSLANQVCYRLMYSKSHWSIIVINQREKSTLNELLVDIISELSAELCLTDNTQVTCDMDMRDLKIQCRSLLTELIDKQTKTLIFMDNMDGHCDKPSKQDAFNQLMKEMLHHISVSDNIKFLMTVGKKLSSITQIAGERNTLFDKQMIEPELKPLTAADTARILRKISNMTENDLPDKMCSKISSLYGGIPLAVSMVANLLKHGYSPDILVSAIKYRPQTIPEPMDSCLKKSFEMLESQPQTRELKHLLARLSVFQTAQFDIQAAVSVGYDTSKDEKRAYPVYHGMTMKDPGRQMQQDHMWIHLAQLKSHFLLEVDNRFSCFGRRKKSADKLAYSLHPLVINYVATLCIADGDLRLERESATRLFLKHFGNEIEKCGEKSDKDPLISRHLVEANVVHIKQFFKIVRRENVSLSELMPWRDPIKHKMSALIAVQRRRTWKIAEYMISSLEKKLLARIQAKIEQDSKNLFGYIYWVSIEAESLLSQDMIQQAEQLIDRVTSELGIVSDEIVCSKVGDWNQHPDEEIPSWASFYMVKGRLYFMKCRNENIKTMPERSMQYLNVAEKLFEGNGKPRNGGETLYSKKYFQADLADLKNLKGCVFFLMKNYDTAKHYHEMAYGIILKLTGNQLHRNLTEYQTNVAACYHQLALNNEPGNKGDLFNKALQYYNKSVGNNKRMKCEMTPSHAGTLRNRAEIYYMQELLEKALADGKSVLKIVRNLYVLPHIEITLAVERVAHYHLKIGKKKQKDMDSEGQGHLEESVGYYDEALMHIKSGGLPIENNDSRTYKHLRENHLKVMKLLRYEQRFITDRIRQYQAFEEGKDNKNIEHNRQQDIDFVPEEFLQEAIAAGELFVPHKMDDSDSDSSETSSSEPSGTNSSSASSSPSPGNPRAHGMMEIEQVLALHRRDSGMEEEEMSDDEMKEGDSFDIAGDDNIDLSRSHEAGTEQTNMDVDASLEQRDTASDNVFVKKTDNKAKILVVRKKSSSSLTKQASIDLPDVAEENESLSEEVFTKPRALVGKSNTTSQSSIEEDLIVEMRTKKKRPGPVASTSSSTGDSGRESWASSTSSSSFECHRKFSPDDARESWRGVRLSESFGSQKRQDTWSSTGSEDGLFTGVQKKRDTWSSAGSQDSVTSQMGRMLNLEDLEEDKDDDVEPARKLKKLKKI